MTHRPSRRASNQPPHSGIGESDDVSVPLYDIFAKQLPFNNMEHANNAAHQEHSCMEPFPHVASSHRPMIPVIPPHMALHSPHEPVAMTPRPTNHRSTLHSPHSPHSAHAPFWYPPPSWFASHQDNARKRQRRQAAGNLVVGGVGAFFGRPNVGSAATAPLAPVSSTSATSTSAASAATSANAKGQKKKQSTAQPRPSIAIPPKGIGPVQDPNENDVLSGRGGRINAHVGNVQFRDMVADRKKDYLAKETKKLEKAHIAAEVVRHIRNLQPSGRFLKEDADGLWWDIGDAKAIKKVGQALREDAPDIRDPELDGYDDEDTPLHGVAASAPLDRPVDMDGSNRSHRKVDKPAAVTSTDMTPIQTNRGMAPSPMGSMPLPPLTTSGSSNNAGKSATAVSSRGGKLAGHNPMSSGNSVISARGGGHHHHQQTPLQHQPVSFQIDLPSQEGYPTAQHRVGTQQGSTPFLGNLGFRTKGSRVGAAVSGAAAAVMQQQPLHEFEVPAARGSAEEAFGRTFHSPPDQGEGSMISGVSITQSGLSGISALTDPISAVAQSDLGPSSSRVARQAMELDRLRPNWNPSASENPAPIHMSSTPHGLVNHNIMNQHQTGMRSERKNMDDMSWTGHSLHGGGLSVRDDYGGGATTTGSVFSAYSNGNDSFGAIMATMKDDAFLNAAVERVTEPTSYDQGHYNDTLDMAESVQSFSRPEQQQFPQYQRPPQPPQPYRSVRNQSSYCNDGASVASISMASNMSLPTVGDLSENLSALDLASHPGFD